MLNIKIYSFSYKKSGIPVDETPNGGGFVFDCRFIYNPGRKNEFSSLTGKNEEVISFLDDEPVMKIFLENVYSTAAMAVENYLHRNFTNLMFSFGCTGGQHRSVYAAEKLAEYLRQNYDSRLKISIIHKEFPELNKN